jgi:hypothetical protein
MERRGRKLGLLCISLMVLALMGTDGSLLAQQPESGPMEAEGSPTDFGTAFTYQGQLTDGGEPAQGEYDFGFKLYDDLDDGTQVGTTVAIDDLSVTAGLFTVELDFGSGAFDGQPRFLDIAVRPGSSSSPFTPLVPRQALTPAPYAHYAATAPWQGLTDRPDGLDDGDDNTTYSAGHGLDLVGTELSILPSYRLPQGCGADQVAKWDPGTGEWQCSDDLTGAGGGYWSLSGDAGTDPRTDFLGTTDEVSLTIRVSDTVAFRLEPNPSSPNLIGGHAANGVSAGVRGATIGGGGEGWGPNRVTDHFGVVAGGAANQAGDDNEDPETAELAVVSGGFGNRAAGELSTIAGGLDNTATGLYATVGGGVRNTASYSHTTIGGGDTNFAQGWNATVAGGAINTAIGSEATVGGGAENSAIGEHNSTVSGGYRNTASGGDATIGGGNSNLAEGWAATVSGGYENSALGAAASVGGGESNYSSGDAATVAGGEDNSVTGRAASVAGGSNITATGDFAAVGGGEYNVASGDWATIGGGDWNSASGVDSVVGGGWSNEASGDWATVGGGDGNVAYGAWATVGGGWSNEASGYVATVAGGDGNSADGAWATVGGGDGNTASGLEATVSGGSFNTVSGTYGTVGGGLLNTAVATNTTVAGGNDNTASDFSATVGGGVENTASGPSATVGGGAGNIAAGPGGTVGGGVQNDAGGYAATVSGGFTNTATADHSTVAGGQQNGASGRWSSVGGGLDNTAVATYTIVAGGHGNSATNADAAVCGGWENDATGWGSAVSGGGQNTAGGGSLPGHATVGGGRDNSAIGGHATIGGGYNNIVTGTNGTVGGGESNIVTGTHATVGGGHANLARGWAATVAGGAGNTARGDGASTVGGGVNNVADSYGAATVGGGYLNAARDWAATVGGGQSNTASGQYSTVPGGSSNTAEGDDSFAAGSRAKANNHGCFVWGDSTLADVECNNDNRWVARASGGVYFYSSADLSTGVYLAAGSNQWTPVPGFPSDRNLKENVVRIDAGSVLERVSTLPMSTWNYKANPDVRHIGPMAQDFHAAFGLGEDETSIHTIDATGVALASIQGLYHLTQDQAAHIEILEAENTALQVQVNEFDARLSALEERGAPAHRGLLPGAGVLLLGFGVVLATRRRGALGAGEEGGP